MTDYKKTPTIGIHIGGSHITAAFVNMQDKTLDKHSYIREYLNSRASSDDIIKNWAKAIDRMRSTTSLENCQIGIAMPGPFDYEQGISYIKGYNKYDALYQLNVKQLLADQLEIPIANIRMLNDASSFLQGEVSGGAAFNCNKAIGLTLGTGLGTSIYDHGQASDANLWHSEFLDGIAEDYISTRWLLKRYYELTSINVVSLRELNAIYHSSDAARAVFKEFAVNLALFIAKFAKSIQPEVVVLGGNISNAGDKFKLMLSKKLESLALSVPVLISGMKEETTIIGAASCWYNA